MQSVERLPLSVVIASTQPWPEVRPCLDSLHSQAQTVGAEIILADGSGQALPDTPAPLYPGVIRLKAPGASVFQLRALAMAQARGEIIAVTEDHSVVRPGWCERILKAHKDHPAAAAIGGAVENGATASLVDWAGFFINNGRFMLPIRCGESEHISLQANISYKRRALPDSFPEYGMVEYLHNRTLRDQGEKLVADDQIVVEHVQSLSFLGTCTINFHNGRSVAGFQLQRMQPHERLLQLFRCFMVPAIRFGKTLEVVLEKHRRTGRLLASLPIIACILCCAAAGEFTGFLLGPGRSPCRLQ